MTLLRILGGSCSMIHGKDFPMNSIMLELENGITFVCTNFKQSRKNPLRVYCYIPTEKKWVITFLNKKLKNIMWDYHRNFQRKNSSHNVNYKKLMHHDRKHKKGSGSKSSSNNVITDYECTKNPMHDFRKSYYI